MTMFQCFDYPGYMRLVLTVPEEQLVEACSRIAAFCDRHAAPERLKHHSIKYISDFHKYVIPLDPIVVDSNRP